MKKATILIGAVFAAIAASACCILPLILGVAGAGTVGLGAALTPYRPYLMGLTLLLLGAGFYFTYRPAKAATCETDCCATDRAARMKRLNKAMLWAVTLFTLGAMAYPQIAAYRAHANASSVPAVAAPTTAQAVVFAIPSMDCAACAVNIAETLKKTPGVYDAKVDFDTKRATVRYDAARIDAPKLREAIDRTGFPAKEVAR
jgi:mercuric ion transport protein